jgi:hypothetical protein
MDLLARGIGVALRHGAVRAWNAMMKGFNCAIIGVAVLIAMIGLTVLAYLLEYKERFMKMLIVLLLASLPAWGQETLDYTGQLMVGTLTGIGVPALTTQIIGDVVLSQALNPNEIDQIVTPTTYNFGGLMVPQLTQPTYEGFVGNAPVFEFSTVNGNITQWAVMLSAFAPGQAGSLTLTNAGDRYSSSMSDGYCSYHSDCGEYSASNHAAGMWVDPPSVQKVTAPELDWTRMAEALTLLCGAALVINTRKSH